MSIIRCGWAKPENHLYLSYHDKEWGVPVHDDRVLFEFLVLESFQAGLSWELILNKRENFRKAFSSFEVEKVARYDEVKVQELLNDTSIVRNKLKINAAVNNARRFIQIQEEFGSFDQYIWRFVEGKPIINQWDKLEQVPPNTALSDQISKELKQKGFKFLGTTVVYSHLQATGLINDHIVECFRYDEINSSYQ